MPVITDHERTVIEALTKGTLSSDLLEKLYSDTALVEIEFTERGYFLTVKHEDLPTERTVFDEPSVVGEARGIVTGFVAFLADRELTLECFSYGEVLPDNYRDREVAVSLRSI